MTTAAEGDDPADDVLKAIATIVSATSKGRTLERVAPAASHATRDQIKGFAEDVFTRVKEEVTRSIVPYRTLKESVDASDRKLRDSCEEIRRDIDRLDQLLVHLERAAKEKREGP